MPVSGGGLISGIALAAKALKPSLRIVGVSMLSYIRHCLLRPLAATAIMAAAVYYGGSPQSLLALAVWVLLGGLIYAAVLPLIGAVNRDDWALMRRVSLGLSDVALTVRMHGPIDLVYERVGESAEAEPVLRTMELSCVSKPRALVPYCRLVEVIVIVHTAIVTDVPVIGTTRFACEPLNAGK